MKSPKITSPELQYLLMGQKKNAMFSWKECDESTETSQCVDVFIAFCQLNHRNVFLFLYGKILFNKITIQNNLVYLYCLVIFGVPFFTLRHITQALVFARCRKTLRTMH